MIKYIFCSFSTTYCTYPLIKEFYENPQKTAGIRKFCHHLAGIGISTYHTVQSQITKLPSIVFQYSTSGTANIGLLLHKVTVTVEEKTAAFFCLRTNETKSIQVVLCTPVKQFMKSHEILARKDFVDLS